MKTLLITGPSAVGKTFLANELIRLYPRTISAAKLYTTRATRQGETNTDRIFISVPRFSELKANGVFLVWGDFAGNSYGYTKETLFPGPEAHQIVNTWPELLPRFLTYEHIIPIALQASPLAANLLITRLKSRGEPKEVLQRRILQIEKDIVNTNRHKDSIEQSGRFFYISNDETIPKEVIPWIADQLGL